MNKEITINGETFKQWPCHSQIFVSNEGKYININRSPNKVRTGSPACCNPRNKDVVTAMHIGVTEGNKTKTYNIGRVILEAWGIPQTYDANGVLRTEVDHIDHNPENNHLSNLRWVTRSENLQNRRPWKHRPFTDEHKRKLSEAAKSRWARQRNPN